jgi:DNA-binding response OmpR family regulator
MVDFFQGNIRVNVISDDYDTGYVWTNLLRSKGVEVDFSTGFLSKNCEENPPDLVIIDETDTNLDWISIIQSIREMSSSSLILYITSKSEESHILLAYQKGVDDCIVKPISPAHFLLKVQALLRRVRVIPLTGLDTVNTSDFTLDPTRRLVTLKDGREVRLSQLEYRLLIFLMRNPGRICNSEEIIQAVWGYEGGDNQLLKHLVFRLRKKIELDPKKPIYIKTENGLGYQFLSQ